MIGLERQVVYIHNGILLSHKKEQNNAICSDMDRTRDSHTELSKSERGRQIPYDITYIWYLIHGTNEPSHRRRTDLEKRLVVAKGEGEAVGWTENLWLIDANHCL